MSYEAALKTLIGPLTAGRMYPDIAPAKATKPYSTYQQTGGQSVSFMEAAVPSKRNARITLKFWGTERAEVMSLARQASDLIVEAVSLQATPLGEAVAVFDEETQLRGSQQDFSVWFDA